MAGQTPDHEIAKVYDVFLSYSRRDLGVALAMVALLKAAGLRVWWDGELLAGQNWRAALVTRIAQSRKVVVLWSPDAVGSEHVLAEVEQGALAGNLVPFRIARCDIPKPYDSIQAPIIPWTESDDDVAIGDDDRQVVLDHIGLALKVLAAPIQVAGVKVKLASVLAGSATFFGRDIERTMLVRAWESGDHFDPAKKTNVVAITAMGGAGKTALIQKFRDDLAVRGYAGATRVYGWSAYSQGSHENKQTSAEPFLVEALGDFGHDIRAEPLDSPRLKAEKLASLIQKERALVILDGLEPLQHPSLVRSGRFKDDGLDALVTALAAHNPGLLVLTSRQHFPELPADSRPRVILHDLEALDQPSSILLLEDKGVVGPRTLPAGPERAVQGAPRSLADLAKAAGYHALTLNLLGGYIANTFGGDLRQIDTVRLSEVLDDLEALDDARGLKARAMMSFYEARFAELEAAGTAGGGKPELAVLSILGLFDRPAEAEAVDLLRAAAIPGLTAELAALPARRRGQQWRRALERLRDLKLVLPAAPESPDDLDAHPLVREHFGERLKAQAPETWRQAHERLYEHYRWYGVEVQYRRLDLEKVLEILQWLPDELPEERPGESQTAYVERILGPFRERIGASAAGMALAELRQQLPPKARFAPPEAVRIAWANAVVEQYRRQLTLLLETAPRAALMALFPPTLPRMTHLLSAIAHGCFAGHHQEVRNAVYELRVLRGDQAFLNKKLGANGADLAALSHFFDEPWSKPIANFRTAMKAVTLSDAAFALRALGRLREAVAPFDAGKTLRVAAQNWRGAGAGSRNLSQLHLVLGNIDNAVATARESVVFVERIGSDPNKSPGEQYSWTTLGDALNAAGAAREATGFMLKAEASLGRFDPRNTRLYAIQGYRFADLRLGQGRASEGLRRGALAKRWASQASEAGHLEHACGNLNFGRALAALDGLEPGHTTDARQHLDAAVDRLRKAGGEDDIPLGLLARAEFFIQTRNLAAAEKDLTEALAIAHRGEMHKHETDAMLGFARLSLAAASERAAREPCLAAAAACWRRAVKLITETGYKRRLAEASLIEAEIALARAFPNGFASTSTPPRDPPQPLRRAHSPPPCGEGSGVGGPSWAWTAMLVPSLTQTSKLVPASTPHP